VTQFDLRVDYQEEGEGEEMNQQKSVVVLSPIQLYHIRFHHQKAVEKVVVEIQLEVMAL
jgi:hypothetical protein